MDTKRNILLVEDDEVILSLIKEFLESADYSVQCAQNGEEALHVLHAANPLPQLIILDLMMPIMDGFQFMQEQQKHEIFKKIPVVAMSADNQINDKLRSTTANGSFKKPVQLSTILEAVQKFCDPPTSSRS